MTVGSHQEKRQRVLLHGAEAFIEVPIGFDLPIFPAFPSYIKKSSSFHNDLFYLQAINH